MFPNLGEMIRELTRFDLKRLGMGNHAVDMVYNVGESNFQEKKRLMSWPEHHCCVLFFNFDVSKTGLICGIGGYTGRLAMCE